MLYISKQPYFKRTKNVLIAIIRGNGIKGFMDF